MKEKGIPIGFELSGHAEQGEYGSDLVCAAISGIVQTTILGITEVVKASAAFSIEENDTHCAISKDASDEQIKGTALLIETMQKGLESIELTYSGTLKIKIREV